MQPRTRSGSHSAQSNAPSSTRPEPSVISSLSYLSSPSLHPTTLPAPPSPNISRPSPYPNTHSRVGSDGALLAYTDGLRQPPEAEQDSRPPPPPLPPVPPAQESLPQDSPRNDDRGSVRDYDADDGRSILGDGSARIALRSLSPRTAEVEHRAHSKRRVKEKSKAKQMTSSPLANPSTTSAEEGPDSLSLRTTSPFQVDFDETVPKAARLSTQSRVRFDDALAEGTSAKEGKGSPARDESRGQSSRGPFRLTPQTSGDHLRDTSFLDFTSSSDGSILSRSNDNSSSSRSFGSLGPSPQSHWSTGASSNIASLVPPPQPRSRWSATTAPSSLHPERQESSSSSDSNFPFPVSLPASPHHPEGTFMPPPPPRFVTQSDSPGAQNRRSALSSLNAHPADLLGSMPTSPTDSDVPMSISDIHFQQSDSDEQAGSHLPAHPPLPPMAAQPPEEAPYIVQRVVGMSSTPSIGNTLGTPTPTATRFNTISSSSRPGPGSSSSKGRDL